MKKAAEAIKRFSASREFYIVLYAILGLLAALSIWAGIKNALIYSQDFQYDAAKALIEGYDPYIISLEGQRSPKIDGLEDYYAYYESINAPQKMEANQFPSLLYLISGYCLFSPGSARVLWLVSNLFFTALFILFLRLTFMKETETKNFAIFVLLMLAGTPWRNQLGVGQHTLFSAAFFLLAVVLSKKSGEKGIYVIPAGLCLAVSFFKYTLTVPMAVYFIYKRRWKELAISAVFHVALTFAAAAALDETFIDMIIKPLKVSSALSSQGSMDIGALLGGGALSLAVTVLIMVFLMAFAVFCPKDNDSLVISICVLMSLIMTYHRLYDFFVMVIVFSFFNGKRPDVAEGIYSLVCCAVFFIPRILNESFAGIAAAAVPYYVFTIFMTVIAVRTAFLPVDRQN